MPLISTLAGGSAKGYGFSSVTASGSLMGGVSQTGLHSWYDASNAASITSSGGAVSQWNDLSVNARHASQATSGFRPTTGTTTQNGKNVINFDGASQFLVASANITSNAFTLFSVYRRNNAAPTGNFGRLFSLWGGPGTPLDYDNTQSFEVHASAVTFGGVTPPLIGLYRNASQVAASTIVYGTSYLFSGTLDGGNWSQNNSGTVVTGTTSTSSTNVANNTLGAGMAAGGGDAYFNGFFAEQIIFTRVLSAGEITTVRNYLSTKWGV